MLVDARGEAADDQRHQHKYQQGNGVGGIGGKISLRLMRNEVAVQEDRRERDDDRLPESAEQRGGHHNQQVKEQGHRKQPSGPVRQKGHQRHGDNPQRTLQNEE